ncbi:MAG: hypothetical protein NZO16_05535 [Deltaproteobacteria bacterium]|nr:hypothetical protein [Deltaproteobacteria bacterium]
MFIFYFGTRVSLISSINPFDLISFLLVGFSLVSESISITNLVLVSALVFSPSISPLVLILPVLHKPSYTEFILYAAPVISAIYGMYGAKVVYNPTQLIGLVSGFGFTLYGLKSFASLELNQGFAILGALTLIHCVLLFAFKGLCQQNS